MRITWSTPRICFQSIAWKRSVSPTRPDDRVHRPPGDERLAPDPTDALGDGLDVPLRCVLPHHDDHRLLLGSPSARRARGTERPRVFRPGSLWLSAAGDYAGLGPK